jgi:hypothetical protein
MNGWDLFTWINAIVLLVSSIVIFIFFLRDARELLQGERTDDKEDT